MAIEIYVGKARSQLEVRHAINLAVKIFRPLDDSKKGEEVKERLLSNSKLVRKKDVVVVAKNGAIIATCFLVDRYFYFENKLMGTFLSSICVDDAHRGAGFSKLLMSCALKECEYRKTKFAIVIARRAADYYYQRFNFFGISDYSKISINLKAAEVKRPAIGIRFCRKKDIKYLRKMHHIVYSNLHGSCVRSLSDWESILWRVKLNGFQIIIFTERRIPIGYAVLDGNEIFEIAGKTNIHYLKFLFAMSKKYLLYSFNIHTSMAHPIANEIDNLDYSITKRQCSYGGHMACIIDKKYFINLFLKKITGIKRDSKFLFNEILNKYKLKKKLTEIDNLIFDHTTTCLFLGADFLSDKYKFTKSVDLKSFNIPFVDQN